MTSVEQLTAGGSQLAGMGIDSPPQPIMPTNTWPRSSGGLLPLARSVVVDDTPQPTTTLDLPPPRVGLSVHRTNLLPALPVSDVIKKPVINKAGSPQSTNKARDLSKGETKSPTKTQAGKEKGETTSIDLSKKRPHTSLRNSSDEPKAHRPTRNVHNTRSKDQRISRRIRIPQDNDPVAPPTFDPNSIKVIIELDEVDKGHVEPMLETEDEQEKKCTQEWESRLTILRELYKKHQMALRDIERLDRQYNSISGSDAGSVTSGYRSRANRSRLTLSDAMDSASQLSDSGSASSSRAATPIISPRRTRARAAAVTSKDDSPDQDRDEGDDDDENLTASQDDAPTAESRELDLDSQERGVIAEPPPVPLIKVETVADSEAAAPRKSSKPKSKSKPRKPVSKGPKKYICDNCGQVFTHPPAHSQHTRSCKKKRDSKKASPNNRENKRKRTSDEPPADSTNASNTPETSRRSSRKRSIKVPADAIFDDDELEATLAASSQDFAVSVDVKAEESEATATVAAAKPSGKSSAAKKRKRKR